MLDEIAGIIMTLLGSKPTPRQKVALAGIVLGSLTFIFSFKLAASYLNSPRPIIEIVSPVSGSEIADSETLLQGKVIPPDSKVVVNGKPVIQNGDGSFSQIIELSEGKNTLKIEAQYFTKKSGLLYRALRVLSEEEKNQKALADQKTKDHIKETAQKLADTNSKESVLGATKETTYDQSIITSNKLIKDSAEKIITGSITNTTEERLGWIKITAEFKNEKGEIVDTKEAYITRADQYLDQGAELPYSIPASNELFSTYTLKVMYEAM